MAQTHPTLVAASLYGLQVAMGGLPRTLLSWGVEEMVGDKIDAAKAYAIHKAASIMEVEPEHIELATAGIGFGFELFIAGRVKKSLDHAKDVSKGVEKIFERANAKNPLNRANLNKDLGSQQQISEKGKIIAGDGSLRSFKGAEKAAEKYGGEPKDWVKMTSSKHKPVDGKAFETHWLENIKTGERVEFKTKILE